MELKPLPRQSGTIKAAGYDPAARELHIQFHATGKTYRYANVPADKWAGLLADKSHGAYFSRQIRPVHKGETL
jgi:hypothetical protein